MFNATKVRYRAPEPCGPGAAQVFTLFKTSRTHMFLACCLVAPAPSHVAGPDGLVAVRSQQDLLAGKDGKAVTGAWPRATIAWRMGFLSALTPCHTMSPDAWRLCAYSRPGSLGGVMMARRSLGRR